MLSFLPGWLRGTLGAVVFGLNTLFWSLALYVFALIKLVIPVPFVRDFCSRTMAAIGESWISVNGWTMSVLHRIEWDVQGLEGLHRRGSYLVCANHQAWSDIVILQKIFNRRIPFLRFFLKRQLIYVPLLGLAWWALDFPFMRRYTKSQIAKDPRRRGKDMEATRKACERFRGQPVSILNFVEGTRFTETKHARQESPYKHLLQPKLGGLSFVLGSMGDQFDALLDVTIFYPDGRTDLWGLFSGRVRRVVVRVRRFEIPTELSQTATYEAPQGRTHLQSWVRGIWNDKDQLLEDLGTQAVGVRF